MKFYIGSSLKNVDIVNYYSRMLEEKGWEHTYNWTKNLSENETVNDLKQSSKLELEGIIDSDSVIILLPAGRGTHVELGMSIALNKKIFLCANNKEEFGLENPVNSYYFSNIIKLVGTPDKNLKEILNS